MLMPIMQGGKLRSPRAHAVAATQEISDCWEVDWPNIKLVVIPLGDGTKKYKVYLNFNKMMLKYCNHFVSGVCASLSEV
jgi:hypothetical protein